MKDQKISMRIETNYLCMLDDLCEYYMRSRADMITWLIRREFYRYSNDIQAMKENASAVDTKFAIETLAGERE